MDTWILSARHKKLLSILNAKHGVESGKKLAAELGVSERTVRNDISEINLRGAAAGICIHAVYGKGYELEIKDRGAYLSLLAEKDNYLTRDDRTRTLLLRLLWEPDWYDLGLLEDEMFVSRTTLETDLRYLKERVWRRHPYLQLLRQGNSVRLEEDERKKRALLIRIYQENWDYDTKDGIVLRQEELSPELLKEIQTVLHREVTLLHIVLDDLSLIYTVLAVAVMAVRVKAGYSIRPEQVRSEKGDVLNVIRRMLKKLSDGWGITFAEEEYIWLSDIFRQLQILNIRNASKNVALKYTDPACHQIVNGVFFQIEKHYGLDFSGDDSFFIALLFHVQAIAGGIIAPQMQNHIVGNDLRRRYPVLGHMAHTIRLWLEQQCQVDLWQDEEDYLLPLLICAQQKLYAKKRGAGIPAVLISHFNAGLTTYMLERLKKLYGDVLDIKGAFAVHERAKAGREKPMIVFTTVRLRNFYSTLSVPGAPIISLSPLIEKEEQERIEACLEDIKCNILYTKLPHPMEYYLQQEEA